MAGMRDALQRRVEVGSDLVDIADRLALLRPLGIDVDGEDGGIGHAAGERLRAPHAAEPGGQDEASREIAAEVLLGDAHEDLVGALDDALAADILPGAGGEPAPADQALLLQLVEIFGLRPLADDVAVRHDDDRRLHLGAEEADRLARLHHQRLVFLHRRQRLDDGVMRGPVARRLAERRIDDEAVGILADREYVFQEPQQALLPPALAAERRSRGDGIAGVPHHFLPFRFFFGVSSNT